MYDTSLLEIDECVNQCQKLIELIELDSADMSKSLSGDIYEAYKGVLEAEKIFLKNIKQRIMRCNGL